MTLGLWTIGNEFADSRVRPICMFGWLLRCVFVSLLSHYLGLHGLLDRAIASLHVRLFRCAFVCVVCLFVCLFVFLSAYLPACLFV